MIKTKSLFLICVSADKLLTAIMLPNTKHIANDKHIHVINKLNDVIGFHNSKKVTTGNLCLMDDGSVVIHANSDNKPRSIKSEFFGFQKCKKRFLAHDLMNENGELLKPHIKQHRYLDSTLITHAWAALHKGHVVGLITYPYLKSHKLHDKVFFQYQSMARKALQTIGHVVACDVVLDSDKQLRLYNIHSEYERKGKIIPYFTRELPITSHLKFES